MSVAAKTTGLGICTHPHANGDGLALISIGNSLRRDDGVAGVICGRAMSQTQEAVCYFELGLKTAHLLDCLSGHACAIIVDATSNGFEPGLLLVRPLRPELNTQLYIPASHAISWWDEIRMNGKSRKLPETMLFFGIEVADSTWGEGLSDSLIAKVPDISERLVALIHQTVEMCHARSGNC